MELVTLVAAVLCSAGPVFSRSLNLPAVSDTDRACKDALRPDIVDNDPTYILSPNFDGINRYPAGALCIWTLRAPPGKVINLAFEEFSLQDSLDCVRDRVALYAGEWRPPPQHRQQLAEKQQNAVALGSAIEEQGSAALLARWCGPWLPRDYALTPNAAATLVFSSGRLGTPGLGFVARYYLSDAPVKEHCKGEELRCRNGQCVGERKRCDRKDDCGDGTDEENCGAEVNGIGSDTCGRPLAEPFSFHVDEDAYIVGGRKAKPESWPWQASLKLAEDPVYGHKCGATLVDRLWLVSAAHCFRTWGEPSDWVVYVGKYNLFEEESTQQLRYVESIFIHPGYQMAVKPVLVENRKDHDIALIKLNAPVTLNGQVQPICLQELPDLADNTTCYVTGWGATREAEMSPVLKQAAVLVLPLDECASYYNGTCVINQLMYCAGYEDGRHDSCHGDSGGPLVVKQGGSWQLAGVISGGLRCGEPRHPGIYTKVTPHYSWIRDVIAGNVTHS
ncbi:transmembrane protease serine 9 [Rhipicephalus microplus]|uniref:transmembrane protease serine 9 n=1 Tax=Rhipicephalus microplus TaxID=6941 RepID=UPI001888C471|nr:serine protease 41-like [Rhipicephalus microplus]